MSGIEGVLKRAADDLAAAGVSWALVGGLAVSARTEPRFTRDIDVAVSVPGDREAESLVRGLIAAGYGVEATVEQTAVDRLSTVRMIPPGGRAEEVVVDLLFASSGIEPEIVRTAEAMEVFPGLRTPVARLPHLIATKVLSRDDERRPQDLGDLRALLRASGETDLQEARAALRLIQERGFAREKHLISDLEALLARP